MVECIASTITFFLYFLQTLINKYTNQPIKGIKVIIRIFNILFQMQTFSNIEKIIAIRDKVYINTEIAPQFWSINPKSLSISY